MTYFEKIGGTPGVWVPDSTGRQHCVVRKDHPATAICITGYKGDPKGKRSERDAELIAMLPGITETLKDVLDLVCELDRVWGFDYMDELERVIPDSVRRILSE